MTAYQNEGRGVDMPLGRFLTPDLSSGSWERMCWMIRLLGELKWLCAQVVASKNQGVSRLIMELMFLGIFICDLYNKTESTVQQIRRHH